MKILIFGDSNTWGYDPKTGDRQSGRFVELLQNEHPEWSIVDNGQNGRLFFSFSPFFGDVDGSKQISQFLGQEAPYDLVIILLGTNDARRMFHRQLSNWLEAFKQFKDILVQTNQRMADQFHRPVSPIWFVPPCKLPIPKDVLDFMGLESTMGESGRFILEKCEKAMQQASWEENVYILPTPSFRGGRIDGIHFGTQEHQAMAAFLEKAILENQEKILKKRESMYECN